MEKKEKLERIKRLKEELSSYYEEAVYQGDAWEHKRIWDIIEELSRLTGIQEPEYNSDLSDYEIEEDNRDKTIEEFGEFKSKVWDYISRLEDELN